jgi:hypothetical protein
MRSRWSVLGRDRERAELDRAWSDAVAGAGGVVVLDGEAGVGKTALAGELVRTVRATATPVWVSCVDQIVPAPQSVLDAVLAEIGARLEPVVAGGDADGQVVATADAFARAVVASASRPLLVIVDDVQWADEVSLRVLALAAPRVRESCVLVLATLRTGEPSVPSRRSALATLLRSARRLPVPPLREEAAGAVVDAAAPHALPERLRRRVLARARGNPLFLRELAVLASIDPSGFDDEVSLPETIRSVLDRRLAAIDAATRSALEHLAVCGDDLIYPHAAAALDCTVDEVLAVVARGVAAEVLQSPSGGRVRFAHPLVRDVLVAGVPYPRRVRLHQQIGRQLVALAATGADVDVALVAGHLCAAAPAGEAALAVSWAMHAAGEATARLAYGAAADWYGRALDALGADPGVADRFELLSRSGDALEAAGDRARARASYLDAFRLARTRADTAGMARAAIGVAGGSGFEITVGDDVQLSALDEAIAALGDGDASLRSTLLARRSVVAALRESPERRREAAQDALALARRAADVGAECAALAALCDAMSGPTHAEERLRMADEMATIAAKSQDPKPLLLALRLSAVAQLELGDITGFDRTVGRYEAVAGAIRQPLYDWYVPLWRAVRRGMAGDIAGARASADRAEAIGLAGDSENARILVGCLRAFLAVDTGDTAGMVLADTGDLPGLIDPWTEISTAYVAAARGELEPARRVADQLPHLLPRVPVDSEYLPTLGQAARIVAWIGGHPVAATLYELLLPHRRRFVVEGIGAYVHGPVERFLGLLAAVLDRPEPGRRGARPGRAAEHFAAARELAAAAGAGLLLRLVDADSGRRVAPPAAMAGRFQRDGEGWVIALAGSEIHMRDSKGIRDLAVLVARPHAEVAAVRLAGRAEPASRGEPMLDDHARTAYRARLTAIDAEMADAEAAADLGRLEKAQLEREFLIAELTEAAGLAGRTRRMGDDVERARTAVTARLRDAIRRIDRVSPELGEHFRRSVRTGVFCCYDPAAQVQWEVSSHTVRSGRTPSG